METLGFFGLAFRWPYDSLKSVFAHFLDVDHIAKLLEPADFIRHCLPNYMKAFGDGPRNSEPWSSNGDDT
ncbi:hypothetical protein TNCV_687641 [Trichonephila clavipes]|nr:hypothetical protein TNCV_687641 [Trichonephila clavipes]